MSTIVQLVISFDLAVIDENATTTTDMSFSAVMTKTRTLRLGLMRLSEIELLDKLQLCYGLRMLEVFREADLFSMLLKMYALYPYNDIALRYVTNIISFALDHKLAKE